MNIFEFYFDLFLRLITKISFKDWITGIMIPSINIGAVLYIFKAGQNFQSNMHHPSFYLENFYGEYKFEHAGSNILINQWHVIDNPFSDINTLSLINKGNGNANDVRIEISYMNPKKVIRESDSFTTVDKVKYSLNYTEKSSIGKLILNDQTKYSILFPFVNLYDKFSYRKMPAQSKEILPISSGNLALFNYYIVNENRSAFTPVMNIKISYIDDFGKKHKEEINAGIKHLNSNNQNGECKATFEFGEINTNSIIDYMV